MSTKFLSPGWRMPRNANQSKQSNYSLHQPDQADYIETDYSINGLTQITVSCWIKTTTNQPNEHIWSFPKSGTGSGFGLQFGSSANTGYSVFNYAMSGIPSVTDTSSIYNDGNWHNIIITSSLTEMKMYVDGVLIDTTSITATAMSGTIDKFFIGSFSNVNPQYNSYSTSFSDVCIFNYALSSSQVTTLWGGGPSVSNPMALPRTPVAYYPLGESAGGFVGGTGTWLTENNAIGDYVFDFSSDLIDSNFTLTTGQTQFSASIWVKFTGSLGNDESLIANESGYSADGFAIFKNASNTIEFRCESQSAIGTTTIALNKWYLATATYNAGAMVLYVNGQQEATQTTATSITQPSTPKTRLGKYITGNLIPFTGELSNAQIFNTALSATEVETLYNYGSPIRTLANIPQNSNLKAWYKLDASEVYDSSNTQWQIANNVLSDKAYSFNGTNNIEITQNSSIQTSNFSIGFWVKGYPQSGKILFENGGANGFSIKTDLTDTDAVRIVTGGTNGLKITGALNGEWNFVWFTWNGGNSRGGLNGGYNYSGGGTTNYDSSKGLFIGSDSSSSNGFVGEIAQVVYYDGRGDNYATGTYGTVPTNPPASTSSTANLVSWWKLDAASITDSNGSNNGTNNGATLIDTNVGRPAGIGGLSSGMNQSNLVQSDLQTVAPYSKYAMSFDGVNDWINIPSFMSNLPSNDIYTISTWVKTSVDTACLWGSSNAGSDLLYAFVTSGTTLGIARGSVSRVDISNSLSVGEWTNVVAVFDTSTNLKIYIDNVFIQDATVGSLGAVTDSFKIAGGLNAYPLNCSQSNVSIWNTALTSAQVSEIYNEGLPGDLNSHSAYSNLISWWQLGENSSFDGNDWICADEKGNNNGESNGMSVDALTNGVGTTANGTSTGMAEGNLVGDAPYSTANAISSGMAVTAKGTDVPS